MESVLVGVDRSESCIRAVEFALARARINSWRVVIAHVIPWSPYSFSTLEDNELRPLRRRKEVEQAQAEVIDPLLDLAREEHGLLDGEVSSEIRHGQAAESLLHIARHHKVDMIAIGRLGESGLRRAIFGSVPNRLVQQATIPVVVVP